MGNAIPNDIRQALKRFTDSYRQLGQHISRQLEALEYPLPGLDKRDRRVSVKPRVQELDPAFCDGCVDRFDRRVWLDREDAEATGRGEADVVDDEPLKTACFYESDGSVSVEVKTDSGRRPEGQSFNIVIHCSPHSSVGDTPKASGSGPGLSCDCGSEPAGGEDQ